MGMDAVSDWPEDQQRQVEQAVFRRLDGTQRGEAKRSKSNNEVSTSPRRLPLFSTESAWHHVWMLYAAGILLFVSLGFYLSEWAYVVEPIP